MTSGAGAALVPVTGIYGFISLGIFLVGLGWSAVFVASTAIIADTTAPQQRGRAIGVNDSLAAMFSISLPLLGGVIVETYGLLTVGLFGAALVVLPMPLLARLREGAPGQFEGQAILSRPNARLGAPLFYPLEQPDSHARDIEMAGAGHRGYRHAPRHLRLQHRHHRVPNVREVFDTSTSTVVWVSLAFQLITLGLVLPMGRLGDLYGRHPIFTIGLGVYLVGLLLAAVSPNIWFLIGVRALLGVAAAMTGAISVAIVTSTFPSTERGKALGVIASVAGIGLMVGPSLGGVLLDTLGWRSIFYVRAPVALVSLLMAMRYLPAIAASRSTGRMDIPGAVLLFVSLVTLAFGINQGGVRGWASPQVIGLLAFGIVGSVTFIMFELRSKEVLSSTCGCSKVGPSPWPTHILHVHRLLDGACLSHALLPGDWEVAQPTSAGLVLLTKPHGADGAGAAGGACPTAWDLAC